MNSFIHHTTAKSTKQGDSQLVGISSQGEAASGSGITSTLTARRSGAIELATSGYKAAPTEQSRHPDGNQMKK